MGFRKKLILVAAFVSGLVLSPDAVRAHSEVDVADPSQRVQWRGPDGELLPFNTHQDVLEFLKSARVISKKRVGKGVNNPLKLLLEEDGVRAHAIFRSVKISKERAVFPGNRVKLNFRDDALFEVAAYRLSRLLGMREIPPTVERSFEGRRGSLQFWIESARTEKERVREGLVPGDVRNWRNQNQTMMLFDNLISNEDRNQGNILYDSHWTLWLVDHTRSFRESSQLMRPRSFHLCDEKMWQALQRLDRKTIQAQIGRYLTPSELRGLMARHRKIVQKLGALIQERGAELVLF